MMQNFSQQHSKIVGMTIMGKHVVPQPVARLSIDLAEIPNATNVCVCRTQRTQFLSQFQQMFKRWALSKLQMILDIICLTYFFPSPLPLVIIHFVFMFITKFMQMRLDENKHLRMS